MGEIDPSNGAVRDDSVFRVSVCLDTDGPRSGLPLETGFGPDWSFHSAEAAEERAEAVREDPSTFFDDLRAGEALSVSVFEDPPHDDAL